ncbi:MAG: hypothetical protein HFG84_16680, partial [Dorea sp.]|nr:hypothetical protein [Dorea sp.]
PYFFVFPDSNVEIPFYDFFGAPNQAADRKKNKKRSKERHADSAKKHHAHPEKQNGTDRRLPIMGPVKEISSYLADGQSRKSERYDSYDQKGWLKWK